MLKEELITAIRKLGIRVTVKLDSLDLSELQALYDSLMEKINDDKSKSKPGEDNQLG